MPFDFEYETNRGVIVSYLQGKMVFALNLECAIRYFTYGEGAEKNISFATEEQWKELRSKI